MKKKLLSLVMACAMIMSLAIPALADPYYDYETAGTSLTPDGIVFAAKTHVPTVSLAMPALVSTSNPVVLNPYKLTYSTTSDTLNEKQVLGTADQVKQVISPVYSIENKTNVALKFAVKATTELNSDAFSLNTSHVSLTEKNKKAYIALVIQKAANATGAATIAAGTEEWLNPDDTANYETVVLASGDKSTNNSQIKKLAATNGTTANYLRFQFQGDMTRSPDIGWTSDDTFTTTLEFTFTPEGNQDYTASATLTTSAAAGSDLGSSVALEAMSAAAVATTSATATKYHNLVKVGGPATVPIPGTTTAVVNYSDLASSTPGWALISAGAFGATIDASTGVVTYPTTMGKLLTGSASGAANIDNLIIGFTDATGVPRTIAVTVTITHTHASS